MEKKDRLFISIYNDYYGSLLTDYQRGLIDGYYNHDMSLSELAEEHGISPQGVRDALKRAERQLEGYESKLGLVEKNEKAMTYIQEVKDVVDPKGQEILKRLADVLND